jgi:hypothetical protein
MFINVRGAAGVLLPLRDGMRVMHLLLLGIRWAVAIPAFLVFVLCLLGNWATIVGFIITINRSNSKTNSTSFLLPFVGPLLGVTFFLVVPLAGLSRWFWLPIVIDPLFLLAVWSVLVLGLLKFPAVWRRTNPSLPRRSRRRV